MLNKTKYYDPKAETHQSGSKTFHNAFPDGFLWELIEILSPPPKVTFKWRHWGTFRGNFKKYAPTGETIEIVGVSIAHITEDLKILSLEHFFDNSMFLSELTKGCPLHNKIED